MESDATTVRWPGGDPGPDPWDDRCWPSLDGEGRYRELFAAWHAWRTGEVPLAALEAAAEAAGVDAPVLPDRNTPDWGRRVPSIEELARIALDHWPAAGADAPDLVLGPSSTFAPIPLRLTCVAGCAFARAEDMPHNAFHVWCRCKPVPSARLRAEIRAVELAPWALWAVDRVDVDGRVGLRDLTGLGEAYLPEGPARVLGADGVRPGDTLAARVLRGAEGWVAHCAIVLPVRPPAEAVTRWIRHETWLARTLQPGITLEALLRKRPVLIRRTFEVHVYGQSPPHARGVTRAQ